jgi:hypothetical protein
MRQTLASTILCLLAARIIYEDADSPLPPASLVTVSREVDSLLEPPIDVLLDRPSESLFERLLCVLHALLGNSKPSWLKTKLVSKPAIRAPRDITAFDSEAAVGLQVSSMLNTDKHRLLALLNYHTFFFVMCYIVCFSFIIRHMSLAFTS